MPLKVLITCPPMLGLMGELSGLFKGRDVELTCPRVVQTLTEAELIRIVPLHDGWIIGDDPATRPVLEAGRKGLLKAAVKWGVGTDNVDMAAAAQLGIRFSNTPGLLGRDVADLAMSYVTSLARHTYEIDRGVREGSWIKPAGTSLADKRIALVGYGDVGRNIAKRARAADMRVRVYDPAAGTGPLDEGIDASAWPDRLEEADFVVLACSLTPANRHLLDRKAFLKMKKGVRVVNVARGGLIDEPALEEALAEGRVGGAALDVFAEEPLPRTSRLRGFSNCIFGTHNASNTAEAVRATSERAAGVLFGFLGI